MTFSVMQRAFETADQYPAPSPWTQVSNLAAIVRDQEKTIIDLKLRVAQLEALAEKPSCGTRSW
jgi:hypothetical protein